MHRLDFVVQTTATPGNAAELPGSSPGRPSRAPSASTSTSWSPPAGVRGSRTWRRRGSSPSSRRSRARRAATGVDDGPRQVRAPLHAARPPGGPGSPVLSYRTRCPCGIDYCRITPDGKLTPCPYMPDRGRRPARAVVRGDLVGISRARRPASPRARRPLRPLRVPPGVRRLPRPRPRHERRLPRPRTLVRVRAAGDRPLVERRAVTYGSTLRRVPRLVPGRPGARGAGSLRSSAASSRRGSRTFARSRGLDTVTPELLGEIRARDADRLLEETAVLPEGGVSGSHSPRRATRGSTRLARRAGAQLAAAAASVSRPAPARRVGGSWGAMP